MGWAKTTARRGEKHLSFGAPYTGDLVAHVIGQQDPVMGHTVSLLPQPTQSPALKLGELRKFTLKSYLVDIMADDDLTTQGARTWIGMMLTEFFSI